MWKDRGGNMALLGLSRRRKPGFLLPSTSTSSIKTLLRTTGVNRSGSGISVTGNKELIHGMGQNVDVIEMRAAEVPGGGLSWDCKGHYQRAKHFLGFVGVEEGCLFACLIDWFLWVLRMLTTERDSPGGNSLGLSFMNFREKMRSCCAVQAGLKWQSSCFRLLRAVTLDFCSCTPGYALLFRSVSRSNTQNQTLGRKDFLLHRAWCIDKNKYVSISENVEACCFFIQ